MTGTDNAEGGGRPPEPPKDLPGQRPDTIPEETPPEPPLDVLPGQNQDMLPAVDPDATVVAGTAEEKPTTHDGDTMPNRVKPGDTEVILPDNLKNLKVNDSRTFGMVAPAGAKTDKELRRRVDLARANLPPWNQRTSDGKPGDE